MPRRLAGALVVLLFGQLLAALPAAAQEVTVDVTDFTYQPEWIEVEVGSTVTWTNHDSASHTATEYDGDFSLGLQPGQSNSHTFDEEGFFPYFCKLHPEMEGVVQVGEDDDFFFPDPTFERLEAADNIGAAIAFSQTAFEDDWGTFALLGRNDLFADSLASGGAQGQLGAPLLLTQSNSLDPRVLDELERLGVRTVFLLGGPAALAPGVESALRDAGLGVRRVFGENRFSTAVAVAERFYPTANTALVARGVGDPDDATRGFADALGAGAAASATGQPLLLTDSEELPAATRAYLQDNPIDFVTIIGGPMAVSEAVQTEIEDLGIDVDRVAGDDRTGTAAALGLLTSPFGPPPLIVLVDGYDADAWASGFPAAILWAPVLLTNAGELPPDTVQLLLSFQTEGGSVVCGPNVAQTACDRAETTANADGFFGPTWRPAALEPAEGVDGPFSGIAEVVSTPDPGALCSTIEIFALSGDPTAAHIHRASDGAPVVTLSTEPGPFGAASNCAFDVGEELASDIIDNPRDYYVNVHTQAHPDGEITGDLFEPTGAALAEMVGEAEVPGPGDPQAIGFAFVLGTDRPDEVCVHMGVFDLDPPATAAHVHEGDFDEAGPPVITLPVPAEDGPPFAVSCLGDLDEAVVADVMAGDGSYYVNVHNATFPDGAIRGQLVSPFGGPPPEDDQDDQEMSAAGAREDVGDRLRELSPLYDRWTR